jgi:hypothetical protein
MPNKPLDLQITNIRFYKRYDDVIVGFLFLLLFFFVENLLIVNKYKKKEWGELIGQTWL